MISYILLSSWVGKDPRNHTNKIVPTRLDATLEAKPPGRKFRLLDSKSWVTIRLRSAAAPHSGHSCISDALLQPLILIWFRPPGPRNLFLKGQPMKSLPRYLCFLLAATCLSLLSFGPT